MTGHPGCDQEVYCAPHVEVMPRRNRFIDPAGQIVRVRYDLQTVQSQGPLGKDASWIKDPYITTYS
ncbi:hypothetical protein N7454_004240 [Penicillium verhagenii]|nr:hypothetical protein N7454_004240 [Penicillium verhagenii]